ncbi:MAG: transposase [Thermoplasmata archaeon]|nr:transposase [Thermoplasmata archaeon]
MRFGGEVSVPRGFDGDRLEKGRRIADVPGAVERVGDDLFIVKSQSGPGAYKVALGGAAPECNCGDFVERHLPCKHLASVRFYLEKQTSLTSGETTSERVPILYQQAWAAYDKAQTEELRLFDVLLCNLVSGVPEPLRDLHKAGRPPLPISDQLFCAVQKVYSQLSCRRARGLFGFAKERGQLSKAPHYTVSSEVLSRPDITPILHDLITRSALPLAAIEVGFAPDSTGFRTTSFSAWLGEKHGERRENVWLKAHALVGVGTHIIVRLAVTDKDGGDNPQFEPLIRAAASAGVKLQEVYADKAYSARSSYALAEEIGFDLYVPFKSNATGRTVNRRAVGNGKARAQLWRKAFLFFQMHRDEFEAKYHRRSNVESVFSAVKRKFGETLRSRTPTSQVNELLAKALAYNLTVVIHEMFEHGIIPDFLRNQPMGAIPFVGEPEGP